MSDAGRRAFVRRRAGGRCEYCQLPESAVEKPFQVEHVRARQHGGTNDPANLAWACDRCNVYKGPNLTAVDPVTDATVLLFHPRRDVWAEHFRWVGVMLDGLTPTGRGTVRLLQVNSVSRLRLRLALREDDD